MAKKKALVLSRDRKLLRLARAHLEKQFQVEVAEAASSEKAALVLLDIEEGGPKIRKLYHAVNAELVILIGREDVEVSKLISFCREIQNVPFP